MDSSADIIFMRRCLDLAANAEGMTYPNPLVGSVIVHKGLIIGEGYHLKSGEPHAEVNAINSVKDKSLLGKSTLYVNLEPCSHYGKTPPCVELIISSRIPRVVVGTTDTSRKVNGEGLRRLREAGCEVVTGVLERESRWINRRFFSMHERNRPWIILKWAQSADSFLDMDRPVGYPVGPVWISGKSERILVHRWRAYEQSILAGAGTIRTDDPQMNVRDWSGSNPLRLILSASGNIQRATGKGKEVLFTYNTSIKSYENLEVILLSEDNPSCCQISDYLYSRGIQSLIVEGGASVLNHFIQNNLWDEARVFTGNQTFINGVKAPLLPVESDRQELFKTSKLQFYLNEIVSGIKI